ncbi:MAG: phage major capsid protein [Nitrospira sp.]|nr:phage major capsid protein [Nitrospira sp.]
MHSNPHQDHLRARRSAIIAEARDLLNSYPKKSGVPAEAEATFDRLMNEADLLQREIELAELTPQSKRLREGLVSHHTALSVQDAHPDVRAFHNYLRGGLAALDTSERAILLRGAASADPLLIRAAQTTGTGSGGGYAVPDAAMAPLVEAMKTVGGLLPYATIVPSQSGSDLPIPTDNETAIEGEIITENSQHNEGDVALSQVVLQSFLYSSKIIRVSVQLMDDAGFDFGAYVLRKLGERIGRITAKHWIIGSGASQPRGIVTAASVGKTAASATAVTYDELVDLLHSVDPIYRQNGTWLVSDTTFAAFRKLKDGQSRPLYGELANAEPNMLLGHKVSIDPNMPSMTTGQKAIIFGDLQSYYVRLVKGPRVLRLEERYADFAQLGFLSFLRADGDLVDGGGGAVKALQMA